MSKEVKPSDGNYQWLRSLWIGLTIFFGFALVFNFIQWARGVERIDAILVPAVFVPHGLELHLEIQRHGPGNPVGVADSSGGSDAAESIHPIVLRG